MHIPLYYKHWFTYEFFLLDSEFLKNQDNILISQYVLEIF